MKENGTRITCDRCKRKIFSRTIAPDTGVSPEMFEPDKFLSNMINTITSVKHVPEEDGWKEHDGLDFCPKCAEEYGKLVGNFLDGIIENKEE